MKKVEFGQRTVANNSGTPLFIFSLETPQVLEGAEGCQDRSTDPRGVFPLGRRNNLDLRFRQSQPLSKR